MKRHYFVTSAVVLCLGAAAAAACSNSPSTPNPQQPGAGAGNAPGAAGSNPQGGGGAGTAGSGNPAAGNGMVAGNGTGGAAGGTPGAAGSGTGGGGGGTPSTMACKAGAPAPINGSGLVMKATDISAFKYSLPPNAKVTKMAYDPVGHMIVMLDGEGKLFSVDPNVALPTGMSTSPVTTTKPYDSGYKAPDGYGTGVYFPYRGIAFGPDGSLYVMAAKTGGVSIAKGAPPATPGGARTWTTIVTTSEAFPGGKSDNYNHSFAGIAVSPDGKSLFFSSGSRTEHGEPETGPGEGREYPLSSAIFKVPTDSVTDLKAMDEAGLKAVMYADGTRNAFDMAFNANGDLIASDNGPDMDLPDEVNFIEQGKHYGFPWRFGNVDNPTRMQGFVNTSDKRLRAVYGGFALYTYDASFPMPPANTTFTDPIQNLGPDYNYVVADANSAPAKAGANGMSGVTAHLSPLGLAFDTTGALCGDYYKQGFLLNYGPINGGSIGDAGEDLALISLTKADGKYTMHAKQLASGIKQPMDSVLVGNRLFTIGTSDAGMLYVFVLPTP